MTYVKITKKEFRRKEGKIKTIKKKIKKMEKHKTSFYKLKAMRKKLKEASKTKNKNKKAIQIQDLSLEEEAKEKLSNIASSRLASYGIYS